MGKFLGKETERENSVHVEEDHRELLGDDVTVYTTSYGTQYVLTTDLLFSQDEKRQLLKEAKERAATSKR